MTRQISTAPSLHHQEDRRNPAFAGLGCPGFDPFQLVVPFTFAELAFDAVTEAMFFTIPFALLFQLCIVFFSDDWRSPECFA